MQIYKLQSPTVADKSVSKLHEYHKDIEAIIETTIYGLTGDGNRIVSVVVANQLSDAEIKDLKDYLGSSIELSEPL